MWSLEVRACLDGDSSILRETRLLRFQVITQIFMVLAFIVSQIHAFCSLNSEEDPDELDVLRQSL